MTATVVNLADERARRGRLAVEEIVDLMHEVFTPSKAIEVLEAARDLAEARGRLDALLERPAAAARQREAAAEYARAILDLQRENAG